VGELKVTQFSKTYLQRVSFFKLVGLIPVMMNDHRK